MLSVVIFVIIFTAFNATYVGILESESSVVKSCEIALEDARGDEVESPDLILFHGNSCCYAGLFSGTAWAAESYFKHSVKMLVTDSCSLENYSISKLAKFWNVPVFLRSDFTLDLFDPIMFPTVVHMSDITCISAALAVEKVAEALTRSELTLVGPDLQNQKSESLQTGIYCYLKRLDTLSVTHVGLDENNWDSMGNKFMSIRTSVQLIVIDGNFKDPNTAFDKMEVRGLVNDGYIVIWICKNAVQQCQADLKERAYDTKMLLMSSYYSNWETITDQFKTKMGSVYSSDLALNYVNTYATCYTLAMAYKRTGSYDGVAILDTFRSATFRNALFGNFEFDSNGNRLPNIIFAWKPSESEDLMQAYLIQSAQGMCGNMRCYSVNLLTINGATWFHDRNKTLAECVHTGGCMNYLILTAAIVGVVLAFVLFIFAVIYIRYQRNKPYRMQLKINRSEVKVIESKRDEGVDDISNARVDGAKNGLATKRRVIGAYAIYNFSKVNILVFHQNKPFKLSDKDLKFFAA